MAVKRVPLTLSLALSLLGSFVQASNLDLQCRTLLGKFQSRLSIADHYDDYLNIAFTHNMWVKPGAGFYVFPLINRHFGSQYPATQPPLRTEKYFDTPEAQARLKLTFENGLIKDASGKLFDTRGGTYINETGRQSSTNKAIFVMDAQGNFYALAKQKVGELHHSSLLAGQLVAGAGEMRVVDGELRYLSDASGHYAAPALALDQVIKALGRHGGVMNPRTVIERVGSRWIEPGDADIAFTFEDRVHDFDLAGIPRAAYVFPVSERLEHLRRRLQSEDDKVYFEAVRESLIRYAPDSAEWSLWQSHYKSALSLRLDKYMEANPESPVGKVIAGLLRQKVAPLKTREDLSFEEASVVLRSLNLDSKYLDIDVTGDLLKYADGSPYRKVRDEALLVSLDVMRDVLHNRDMASAATQNQITRVVDFLFAVEGTSENINIYQTEVNRSEWAQDILLKIVAGSKSPYGATHRTLPNARAFLGNPNFERLGDAKTREYARRALE